VARAKAKAARRTSRRAPRYIYAFGAGRKDGRADMKALLGGKGANLAEMARLGLPVPPGFTISTEVCTHYYAHRRAYPPALRAQVKAALGWLEKALGRRFGDPTDPLLVSVRSGARASMPGMMDTILNLGLNDQTVAGLIRQSGNARFAYDSYRRFVSMYGDVVLGLKPETKDEEDPFEVALQEKKRQRGVTLDTELDADALGELVDEFKALIKMRKGVDFPEDPEEQLWGAVGAVFGSWMNPRAITYRKLNRIPDGWGTAVNVQSMVFGNMGTDSGTGVAFTRDPATGANVFYGEFLMNAQGEDVVAGIRTPLPIADLERENPKAFAELCKVRRILERHYREVMDIEFTIQERTLYMLQCRVGKRTAFAAIKVAVDMVKERLISTDEALRRIEPEQLSQLLRPVFNTAEKERAVKERRLLARGLNAGPGAATGRIVFNAEDAVDWAARGEPVVLVRIETSPEDIGGMHAAEGILTARGGMTSHAALVARQMGKVCVAGCEPLQIDYRAREMRVAGRGDVLREGDWLSLDGSSGEIFLGEIHTTPSEVVRVLVDESLAPKQAPVYQIYAQLMQWADKRRRLRVRANADQPDQCANALAFGAEGVGLCRTEHMVLRRG
jgi:pyruvate,orthophosphate dikinase